MAAHDAFETGECPVGRTVSVIGDRWSLLIIRDVFDGVHRFGALQRSLGVAKNILTDRLRSLTAHGILELRAAADGSAYSEYVLTDRGKELFHIVVALRQWGEDHLFAEDERHSELRERDTDRPVARLQLLDADGQPLNADDAYVLKVGAGAD
ncbi:winged helix-turn-helix transcriptional regulator [Mycolicibacterium smegmatis]|uniref:Transcriptional regulator family protein n=1 Tax=Mycolicibacterium smegmatis (strain MKD8) TaxID=1214915 RepID=A0A2U9PRC9_MYCSE|nr:helix-turn-helix domain-containing protein [Mycolicibacterium smegmatis]AWT54327.1 transcriptional regulator family protein [Mycolicibacterium smegmatis MKD8]